MNKLSHPHSDEVPPGLVEFLKHIKKPQAKMLHALSNDVRRRVFLAVAQASEPISVGNVKGLAHLQTMTLRHVSQILSELESAHLLHRYRKGRQVLYAAAGDGITQLAEMFATLLKKNSEEKTE